MPETLTRHDSEATTETVSPDAETHDAQNTDRYDAALAKANHLSDEEWQRRSGRQVEYGAEPAEREAALATAEQQADRPEPARKGEPGGFDDRSEGSLGDRWIKHQTAKFEREDALKKQLETPAERRAELLGADLSAMSDEEIAGRFSDNPDDYVDKPGEAVDPDPDRPGLFALGPETASQEAASEEERTTEREDTDGQEEDHSEARDDDKEESVAAVLRRLGHADLAKQMDRSLGGEDALETPDNEADGSGPDLSKYDQMTDRELATLHDGLSAKLTGASSAAEYGPGGDNRAAEGLKRLAEEMIGIKRVQELRARNGAEQDNAQDESDDAVAEDVRKQAEQASRIAREQVDADESANDSNDEENTPDSQGRNLLRHDFPIELH